MEILQNIFKAGLAAKIIKGLMEQDTKINLVGTGIADIKIRLVCTDTPGFLGVDGGMWRATNEYILDSGLIVDLVGSDANGIALEGCALRITQDEFKYFDVECVTVGEAFNG